MKIGDLALALVLTLTTISVAVILTLGCRSLYYRDIEVLNITEFSGYSEEMIRENYDAVIDYNMAFGGGELELPSLPMSEQGRIHFEEVKVIFNAFKFLAIGGVVLSAAGLWFCAKKKAYLCLKWAARLNLGIPIVLAVFVAMFWEKVFVIFHQIFFNNDYWMFDPKTDPIINILPSAFFMHCAMLIVAIVAAGSIVFGLIYRRLVKKTGNGQS